MSSPLTIAQLMKFRDYNGRSVLTLLLESKIYELLQVELMEAAVRTMWLGKKNFDGDFMQDSTAYQAIFYQSIFT